MANFNFLSNYVLNSEKDSENDLYKNFKHQFFKLSKEDIFDIDKVFKIPFELKEFYIKIGYGFFYQANSSINRLLDPESFKMINNKEEYYEFDPTLEFYNDKSKLIFLELNEGIYLTISLLDKNGKNEIYYFEQIISNSLEEFLVEFDNNPDFLDKV